MHRKVRESGLLSAVHPLRPQCLAPQRVARCGPRPPHPAVACGDVLQRAGSRFRRVPVELTALQQPVVQRHDLGAPQPLQALGVLRHLGEGERVGREGQLGRRAWRVSRGHPGSLLPPAPLPRPAPTSRSRRLCGVKQPTASPGSAPAVSRRPRPSSRCRADGGISSYRR